MKMLMQSNVNLNENVAKLTKSQLHFQQATQASIQNLERQFGHISQVVSKLDAKVSGKLPSQTEVNPNIRNVSAITLRSGKRLVEDDSEVDKEADQELEQNSDGCYG